MSKAYVPVIKPNEKHLHIRALMHQRLTHLMEHGSLSLTKVKAPEPKLKALKSKLPKLKKGI